MIVTCRSLRQKTKRSQHQEESSEQGKLRKQQHVRRGGEELPVAMRVSSIRVVHSSVSLWLLSVSICRVSYILLTRLLVSRRVHRIPLRRPEGHPSHPIQ
jgi:hypothetical protein